MRVRVHQWGMNMRTDMWLVAVPVKLVIVLVMGVM